MKRQKFMSINVKNNPHFHNQRYFNWNAFPKVSSIDSLFAPIPSLIQRRLLFIYFLITSITKMIIYNEDYENELITLNGLIICRTISGQLFSNNKWNYWGIQHILWTTLNAWLHTKLKSQFWKIIGYTYWSLRTQLMWRISILASQNNVSNL